MTTDDHTTSRSMSALIRAKAGVQPTTDDHTTTEQGDQDTQQDAPEVVSMDQLIRRAAFGRWSPHSGDDAA